jgi:branched-chain amino acid transport system ATP-binding protein
MSEAALLFRAEGLHKSFGGVRAVQAISLELGERSIAAVIGPNGAGKSTLLNLLSGIHQPDAGRVLLDGRDLAGMAAWRRARLGVARTFQKIRLFRHLTVLENVMAGFHRHHDLKPWQYVLHGAAFRENRRRSEAEALERLAFLGLADRAASRAGALAYGQQRLLEIARALATRPRLFMLDEPAAGLNAGEVEFLTERLASLRRHGMTILVVEHNMDLVMEVADRVLVMDHGERLFAGTPAEVQRSPAVIAAYLGTEAAP